MSGFFLPDNRLTRPEFFYPGRKPAGNALLRQENTISGGIQGFWIANEYSGVPRNCKNNEMLTDVGIYSDVGSWNIPYGYYLPYSAVYRSDAWQPPLTQYDSYIWHIELILHTDPGNRTIMGNRYGGTTSPLQFVKITGASFEYYNNGGIGLGFNSSLSVGRHSVTVLKNKTNFTAFVDGEISSSATGSKSMDANPVFFGGGGEDGQERTEITLINAFHGFANFPSDVALSLNRNPYQILEPA